MIFLLAAALLTASPAIQATDYEDLVCSYDWPCDQALKVMHCESKGYARAFSLNNYGLFQINGIHRARVQGNVESLYDPETNVRVAYAIWSEQGWRPWGCRP